MQIETPFLKPLYGPGHDLKLPALNDFSTASRCKRPLAVEVPLNNNALTDPETAVETIAASSGNNSAN